MAHITEAIGTYSQLIAKAALHANGWIVAETETTESFDFVAKDPLTGDWKTFQCKTIRRRLDRNNELVVYATKGDGKTRYSKSDADYIVGVLGSEGGLPRVFFF